MQGTIKQIRIAAERTTKIASAKNSTWEVIFTVLQHLMYIFKLFPPSHHALSEIKPTITSSPAMVHIIQRKPTQVSGRRAAPRISGRVDNSYQISCYSVFTKKLFPSI